MLFIILLWVGVHTVILALYLTRKYSRFSDFNVKCKPVVPLFGNLFRILFRLDSMTDDLDKNYQSFNKERFSGRYEFLKPVLLIRDLELVKKIAIKDFEYFIDHRSVTNEDIEPLFARNLVSLKGDEWKDMRSTLSPAFTSSKIKLMVPFMEEVGDQMIRALKKKINDSEDNFIEVDCKDLTTRYANDVIASCAFGIKVDSHTDENNEFYKMGKATSTFSFKQIILMFLASGFPKLAKRLNLSIFSNNTKDFFMDIVLNTMKERDAHNIIRPDMIHLLMEAKKDLLKITYTIIMLYVRTCLEASHGFNILTTDANRIAVREVIYSTWDLHPKSQLRHEEKQNNNADTGFATVEESDIGRKSIERAWSDNDLVAQAVLFFIAGFETISTAMSFALHELAANPKAQERLVQEIKEHHQKYGGKLEFNSISNLVYMDMVTSEVLRLWPPGPALDRLCVNDYNLGKPNSEATKDYIVRKGESLAIPVWCFHRDPDFFPNPDKFDPERFSNENKHSINSHAYMPFGVGPRNCIGSRFALCELKVLLYQILLHMELTLSPKTRLPARICKESFNLKLDGGHWLIFKIRK